MPAKLPVAVRGEGEAVQNDLQQEGDGKDDGRGDENGGELGGDIQLPPHAGDEHGVGADPPVRRQRQTRRPAHQKGQELDEQQSRVGVERRAVVAQAQYIHGVIHLNDVIAPKVQHIQNKVQQHDEKQRKKSDLAAGLAEQEFDMVPCRANKHLRSLRSDFL